MEEIEKFPLTSLDIKSSQISKLKELFPEVFTEGNKVDLDRLKLTIGENVDTGKERFGMNWPGKSDCFKAIQQPSSATLIPDREDSVNFDSTENLFIEGDNLEVLKLLQKSYLGKIKMIYIDPPYNTGNDFIYPDNYSENLETYLEYTGQVDSEGRKFGTNTDTDGRFHSKWMNMMYPRLFLAKNLLREDGFVFVSIDDSELDNLKKIMHEIYGEENFRGTIVRSTGQTTGQDSGDLGSSFDYLIVYSKNSSIDFGGIELDKHDLTRFDNEDEKGKYAFDQMRKTGSGDKREDRPNMYYSIKDPDGNDIFPIASAGYESRWRIEKKRYEELLKENYILWKKVKREKKEVWWPFIKYYLEGRTKRPSPLWNDLEGNKKAARDLRAIFNGIKLFDYPKPIDLIRRLVSISTNQRDDIVLDFFAGSCTTAHGILQFNDEQKVAVKFICVQLPEPTDENSEAYKAGYKNIADIGKERIRRVIKKLEDKANQKPDMFTEKDKKPDLGFKVLKLAKSNFSGWNSEVVKTEEAVNLQLFKHVKHISPEAEQEALLYELLLKSGFQLATPIKTLTFTNNTLHEKPTPSKKAVMKVYSIGENELLICLEKNLTHELLKAIAEKKPERVICLDEGFHNNDQLKTNAALIMKSHGVLKFQTV